MASRRMGCADDALPRVPTIRRRYGVSSRRVVAAGGEGAGDLQWRTLESPESVAAHPMTVFTLVVYSLAIFFVSVAGGTLPRFVRLTHARMQATISLIAGLMLGVAAFHLLPHAIDAVGSARWACVGMMAGLLTTFILLRAFHFHHHEPANDDGAQERDDPHLSVRAAVENTTVPEPPHRCESHAGHHHETGGRGWSWAGIALGLSIHTVLDGLALASSVLAESSGASAWALPAGLATFLAIILHKPLDALSIASVMRRDRWELRSQTAINLLFAVMCPIGAFAFLIGVQAMESLAESAVGFGLAFSSGVFLCISLSDLLPEVQFHSHDRVRLTALLFLGVAIALGLEMLPGHNHPGASANGSDAATE